MSLKSERIQRGWTQRQLAERTDGISYGRIADFETGRRPADGMSLETALKLLEALKYKALARKVRAILLDEDSNSHSGSSE